jgi:hypothetical protein
MERIEVTITDAEMMAMKPPIPFTIQMRLLAEKRGMRFLDSGKISAVMNENPIPLGEVIWRDDFETNNRMIVQIIN